MKKQFVIITNQRSGSNMLVSMLNSHPEIKCYGELMRPNHKVIKKAKYRGALRVLENLNQQFQNDRYRLAHPYDFISAVFNHCAQNPISTYGFKLHLWQHPKFLTKLIQDMDWKLIELERENKLAQFSSEKIAKTTGQGSALKGAEIKRATVQFKKKEFLRYLKHDYKGWKRVRAKIKASGKSFFSIKYTDLGSKEHIRNLLTFLEVDSTVSLESKTQKRNTSNILDRFSNKEKVVKLIKKKGLHSWCEESFSS